MFKFAILILALVVACVWSASIPEGMRPQLDGRIVGGSEATSNSQYPYVVSVQRNGAHSCGGSVYSSSLIITAAHCLQAVTAKNLRVRAGSINKYTGGYINVVEAFKNHEGYNPTTMVNDIALIRLVYTLDLNNNIKTIALATSSPYNGAYAVVAGWGTTRYGANDSPNTLEYVNVNIVSQSQCASSTYGYGSQIKDTMICAAAPGKDACQLDSGGPLVSNNALVGIVSWGIGCANANYPGVYTDVAVLRNWVINNAYSVY